MHKGHTVRNCRVRLFEVPNGRISWIPKGSHNTYVLEINRLPIFLHKIILQDKGATNKKLWYLDNKCSKHMTGDASLLTGLVIKHGGFVTYGDNNRGRIIGCGDIGVKGNLIIQIVLLVEGLKPNLLSIS